VPVNIVFMLISCYTIEEMNSRQATEVDVVCESDAACKHQIHLLRQSTKCYDQIWTVQRV